MQSDTIYFINKNVLIIKSNKFTNIKLIMQLREVNAGGIFITSPQHLFLHLFW